MANVLHVRFFGVSGLRKQMKQQLIELTTLFESCLQLAHGRPLGSPWIQQIQVERKRGKAFFRD